MKKQSVRGKVSYGEKLWKLVAQAEDTSVYIPKQRGPQWLQGASASAVPDPPNPCLTNSNHQTFPDYQ